MVITLTGPAGRPVSPCSSEAKVAGGRGVAAAGLGPGLCRPRGDRAVFGPAALFAWGAVFALAAVLGRALVVPVGFLTTEIHSLYSFAT
jgi:hypothetical protein